MEPGDKEAGEFRTLDYMAQIRDIITEVLEQVNDNHRLAVAALANPVLALEELGYGLSDELRSSIVRRARFPADEIEQLNDLSEIIDDLAGRHVDPEDPEDIERLLFDELQLARPDAYRKRALTRSARADMLAGDADRQYGRLGARPQRSWDDPLQELLGQAPVVEPLIEYRALDARRPPLADASTYAALRDGDLSTPVIDVRARLQDGVT